MEVWCELKEVLRLSISLLEALPAPEPLCAALQGSSWVVQDLGGRSTWEEMLMNDIWLMNDICLFP